MSQSRRIRHHRLVGPGRVAALPGLLATRLSRRRRPVALRRPRRNRHVAEDALPPPPPPRATRVNGAAIFLKSGAAKFPSLAGLGCSAVWVIGASVLWRPATTVEG